MDATFATYDSLVHQIYDAALEPTRWTQVVRDITRACGGCSGMLFTPMHGPQQGGITIVDNIPQWTLEHWAARSIREDPYMCVANQRGLVREGFVVNGSDLVTEEELLQTRFYRELWEPIELAKVCSGVVFDGTDSFKLPTVLSIFGRLQDPPFGALQLDFIQRLLPHMSRALGVMYHLRESRLHEATSLATLERMTSGVVLLDGQGRLHFANDAARRQFGNRDLWSVRRLPDGGETLALASHFHVLNAELQRAVAVALNPLTASAPDHFSDALVLSDPAGKPSCVIHVASLGSTTADRQLGRQGGAGARAILFLYDLQAASSVPPKLLAKLFALTPAESRAALQLLQGGNVDVMAERLGVAANTLKSQLKSVYAKTHTHRQADLLKLLLSLATPTVPVLAPEAPPRPAVHVG